MRFFTFFAASLAIGSTAAAPVEDGIQPFVVESGGEVTFNPSMYTTENFTATDGQTYEIVRNTCYTTLSIASLFSRFYQHHYAATRRKYTNNASQSYLTGVPDVQGRSIRSAFHRRQQDSDDPKNRWRANSRFRESCPFGSISGDTGPNAPTTGRCAAVRDWCANNPGNWEVFSQDNPHPGYYPLVSSGKAGTTACHFAVKGGNGLTSIGSNDVRDWARESLNRYTRNFNGVHRVRSYGNVNGCNGVRPGTLRWMLDTLQGIQRGR